MITLCAQHSSETYSCFHNQDKAQMHEHFTVVMGITLCLLLLCLGSKHGLVHGLCVGEDRVKREQGLRKMSRLWLAFQFDLLSFPVISKSEVSHVITSQFVPIYQSSAFLPFLLQQDLSFEPPKRSYLMLE